MADPAAPGRTPLRPELILRLGWSGLFASRRVTALLGLAIVAAVAFQVPNDANLEGYYAALMNEGVSHGYGAVRILPRRGSVLEHADAIAAAVARYGGVRAAVPVLTLPGAVGLGGRFVRCAVRGIDARGGRTFYRLRRGRPLGAGEDDGLLVGTGLAQDLGVSVGDEIQLRVLLETDPVLLPEEPMARHTMTVRGVVEGAFGSRDAVFVDRRMLSREAGLRDEATSIHVYLEDPMAAGAIARRIRGSFADADGRPWQRDSQYIASALRATRAVTGVSIAMALAAAAIPVLSLLYIDVFHRRREVGLLAAIGLDRRDVFLVFLAQAVLVGAMAIPVGCALGAALVAYFDTHPIFEWEGFVIRPSTSTWCFLRPSLFVLAVTLSAGSIPAWLAARLHPARVLRGIE